MKLLKSLCAITLLAGISLDIYIESKYLTIDANIHSARLPFNKPLCFWWKSPSGKRLLAYRSEDYMHGKVLALVSG
ncbi:polysaccharide deacetylase family protein [Hyunsoonleella pacifica]|uniref:Uncharacterized protein n=1 Tax=Hyunsoonleella pacifica TaxID=1080224 RepID=A0A4Q9FTD9_9FLAO|nr:hypothetical protein [Hyunsoonleella pacifica]TBN18950.1 hypothetical protein EYD46_02470 [Hyunsoonleella pacifica]